MNFRIDNNQNTVYTNNTNTKKINSVANTEIAKTSEEIKNNKINSKDSNNTQVYKSSSAQENYSLDLTAEDNKFVNESTKTIKNLLTGAFTDKEEKQVLDILKSAKSNVNNLMDSLNTTKLPENNKSLLENLVSRWDEEIDNYKEPGLMDEAKSFFTGEKLQEKPTNTVYFNDLAKTVFENKSLDKESGKNFIHSMKSYKDKNSLNLQYQINILVIKSDVNNFSNDTKELFRDILKPFVGAPMNQKTVDASRKILDLPLSK